ncbi:efflux RND transporter permease subunit [Candidatus Thiodictyon syntrophicum]|jgi:multidrug efflux pump|uniref:Efflux pump membrane transporter n=1 Tax=Candidatus Thiodictyon syntrophicum TaxID=1166950 RepID=A0A2K8UCK1_9GAMM|nr:multidrug efflux RND transporter permease subunit [Candidatus Thiodictyon syntrophicum]AUB83296.1 hydrophobe/amphiphile efflux-1 family RND transporter [Candidatus Thiodictyon syntrophicum]
MFSHFFIDRPIFAAVIALIISIAGLVAMVQLPIAQYPQVTPIQIQVSATYPGANGTLVAQNVGAPIEEQVNGANNMIYMSSASSSTGNYTLTVYFTIDTNPELAQVDVQNRVSQAMAQLPQSVQAQGVDVQQKTSTFLMVLAFFSPDGRLDNDYISNYTNTQILSNINRIDGANQAAIFGVPEYAMRIWLKPDRMAQLGVTATQLANVVKQQNQQFAVGRIGDTPTPYPVPMTFPVTTGIITEPDQFDNMIVRAENKDAALVRVKDLGYAQLGAQSYTLQTEYQGRPATLIAVYQQPGANSIAVSKEVRANLAELAKGFPSGLDYAVALDTTAFVQASIDEVVKTFFEAVVLVVLVVFIFLHSLRLTIIPTLAVPVSILGALIGMLLLGFSINMLTLFGMILAIGLVVDDAIVVVENTERNMEQYGLTPNAAAKKAMDEVSGPVIAVVLVLNAVFVPVAFLGGITGALYQQFAVTIAISVVFSGFIALTLSPALAAILIQARKGEKKGFFAWFDTGFERITNGYVQGVKTVLGAWFPGFLVLGLVIAGCVWLFKVLPTAFVPQEDQGYIFVPYFLPDSASLSRTNAVGSQAATIMRANPAVANVTQVDGYSLIDSQMKTNFGLLFVSLKDYAERTSPALSANAVIADGMRQFQSIQGGLVVPINPPAIPGLGITAGFQMWIEQKGAGTFGQLYDLVNQIIEKAKTRPELAGVSTTVRANGQQLLADVDREKAEILGVPIQEVYNTLQIMFGSLYVSQFPKDSRLFQVILQAEPSYRMTPEDIGNFYVKNNDDKMIPLSALVSTRYVVGPDMVTRFNNYPAIAINGAPAPGVSSGTALAAIQEVAEGLLPQGYGFEWAGEAREEVSSGSTSTIAFSFGLIFVFLILAAQYESWSLPISVMMAIPFAVLGALIAIALRGIDNDIYFQIGLLTLVGLAAKNAILIVEFAVELHRKEGMSLFDAAAEAARLRLRPIIMTSFAFVLGTLPLAIATGASANSRHSIGTGVIGGTLVATLVAIFFIPMFYWLVGTFSKRFFGSARSDLSASVETKPAGADGPGATGGGAAVATRVERKDV